MALANPSLFLYGFQITTTNQFITFGNAVSDSRVATIPLGYYSLTSLGQAIITALTAADPTHGYTYSVNRTVSGGLQNRFTFTSSNTYFSIYFGSGNPSNPATLLGFAAVDLTGALSYTGSGSCGTTLIPNQLGYSYLSPNRMQKNFGVLNVAASGLKEAVTFNLQSFWQVQFKYIPIATADASWLPLVQWLIQQREIEFTPDISVPTVFYVGTLESPNQGLQLDMTEMLPDFPNYYQTPLMKFRVRNES